MTGELQRIVAAARAAYEAGPACLVLFTSAGSTGKTAAARIIADALGFNLYGVDLTQVVSKYIGETEKNLRRIFEAAEHGETVLLLDEADAVFGKRTAVSDTHDRYANIDPHQFLQRLERHRGPVILATKRKDTLDDAFVRRFQFRVEFPRPGAVGDGERRS
jgi:SpoVK/Ycf46/Vps4 family AAA+-type ATPase